jgi:hypothetical protein
MSERNPSEREMSFHDLVTEGMAEAEQELGPAADKSVDEPLRVEDFSPLTAEERARMNPLAGQQAPAQEAMISDAPVAYSHKNPKDVRIELDYGGEVVSSAQQAKLAEREFTMGIVGDKDSTRYAELTRMTDKRKRDLGALGLMAKMVAEELKADVSDPRAQEIAEDMKYLLDNWFTLHPGRPEKAVETLRQTIKMAVRRSSSK